MSRHHVEQGWSSAVRKLRPIVASTLPAPCVECGRAVLPGTRWHVGHIIPASMGGQPVPGNVGPAHPRCNTSAGGKAGRAQQLGQTKDDRRMPRW